MLFDSTVSSSIRLLIPMELVNGADTGRNMGQFSVAFDFGEVACVGAFGNDEPEQQKGEVAIGLHAPVFSEFACA